jgi:uncharacterized Zn finger protein
VASETVSTALHALSLDDLRSWAGEAILNRGKRYVKRVAQVFRTADDALAAWVTGGERYATSVRMHATGRLEHRCTCPYSLGPCKHAVAVILAAAEHLKDSRPIPLLREDEDLYEALECDSGSKEETGDDWDAEPADSVVRRVGKRQPKLAALLGKKSHGELLDLLVDLAKRFPDVTRHIVEAEQLAAGRVDKLVRALKSEIQSLAAEPAWYDHWRGEGSLPDYSHIEEKLQALTDQGHADAVVQLGDELWKKGKVQVEQSNDEGETAMAIAACLRTVMAALPRSSLTPPEQLLWVTDRVLDDDYGLLDAGETLFKRQDYVSAHWRTVADTLEARLKAVPRSPTGKFSDRYRRTRLLDLLLDAYAHAGWEDRIIPRLEDEADACQCYPRLVDALLGAGERERARQWCLRGHARTLEQAPGIASALQERLRGIAQRERRYDLVAAYRAQDFFDSPSSTRYGELRKAAEKAKCWPVVRGAALAFLETGRHPAPSGQKAGAGSWPLPAPEVEQQPAARRAAHQRFPDFTTLIDIAIAEERLDDVVDLYQRCRNANRCGGETDKRVAQAVAAARPELALAIWQRTVDGLIAQVKPRAYEEAAGYLRLMRQVYVQNERVDDWRRLLIRLRAEHKAKRRLMEVLDNLANKKLVG